MIMGWPFLFQILLKLDTSFASSKYIDSANHLCCLFYTFRLQALMRLLSVPGASVFSAKPGNNIFQSVKSIHNLFPLK